MRHSYYFIPTIISLTGKEDLKKGIEETLEHDMKVNVLSRDISKFKTLREALNDWY